MEPDESTQTLMSDDVLTVRRQGPLAMVRFTQPKTPNAINLRLAVVLTETLRGLAGDPVIRGVVLSREDRAFMAGGDLTYLNRESSAERASRSRAHRTPLRSHRVASDLPCPRDRVYSRCGGRRRVERDAGE